MTHHCLRAVILLSSAREPGTGPGRPVWVGAASLSDSSQTLIT